MSRWAKPGADGTALVHDMLISAMTTKQIAESRCMAELTSLNHLVSAEEERGVN